MYPSAHPLNDGSRSYRVFRITEWKNYNHDATSSVRTGAWNGNVVVNSLPRCDASFMDRLEIVLGFPTSLFTVQWEQKEGAMSLLHQHIPFSRRSLIVYFHAADGGPGFTRRNNGAHDDRGSIKLASRDAEYLKTSIYSEIPWSRAVVTVEIIHSIDLGSNGPT